MLRWLGWKWRQYRFDWSKPCGCKHEEMPIGSLGTRCMQHWLD